MTIRVKWLGPFAKPTGYARASHDYLCALRVAGVDLSIVPVHDADPADLEPRYHHLLEHVHREDFAPTHLVVHTIPAFAHEFSTGDLAPAPGVKRVALTTWETDRLPREIAQRLTDAFDLVIVPCEFNRAVFVEAGVPAGRVAVVPHTYDPAFWRPTQPRAMSPFTFYSIGVWSQRKNLSGLLRAYLSEFTAFDDVTLQVATPFCPEGDLQQLSLRMGLENLPHVRFQTGRLTEAELLDLHSLSNVYVSATRGEGWGLGAFEAAVFDNPVIAPAFGGQTDFLEHYPHWRRIPHQLTPAVTDEIQAAGVIEVAGLRITPMGKSVPLGIQASQNWAEPDLHAMKREMRRAYTARGAMLGRGAIPNALARMFSYETVGKRFRDVLEAM